MKRFLLFIFIFIMTMAVAVAQSMTESQIVDYVQQRNAAGVPQQTIIAELIEKGVSREQLLRIKQTYDARTTTKTVSNHTDIDRSRVNNGENARAQSYHEADVNSGQFLPDLSGPLGNPASASVDGSGAGSRIFGHDIFRSQMLSFEPNMSIAVPDSYILGPGDEVIIDVYGDSQRSDKLKVAPDGTVTTTYGGPIAVSGKTLSQATSVINSRLKGFFSGSRIKVSVGQTRTITVNIMGEVIAPGSYTLSAFASVFHALYQAGGVNDIGTLRDIKVCRRGHVVTSVDVYDYILNGRLTGNIMLEDNDVILVDTYRNLVDVRGWVKRPMLYEMRSGENLANALSYAGGFRGEAFTEVVTVERSHNTNAYVFSPAEDDYNQFLLTDGDVVTVSRSDAHFTNMVEIRGAVYRPGRYEIGEAAQTVRTLVERAGGLKQEALRTRAVLLRMQPDRSRTTLTIDLEGIMTGKVVDIALQNEDQLSISSRERELGGQVLNIDGEVYMPGTYPFASNMTVEDLITIAGGLKESASALNIEVSRRIIDPNGSDDNPQRAEIHNVKINDGLRINEQTSFHLQPHDEVYVRKSPAYSEQKSVWVGGEVLFEGRYVLEKHDERLSDIVQRTGGFTSKACILDARLKRKMNETELLRRQQLIKKSEMDSVSVDRYEIGDSYYVGIDLKEALAHPGGNADLVLRDGDELIIPQFENTVKINGEVLFPNTVTYIEGKRFSYYINQAGGYSRGAHKRGGYIIYNNGNVSKVRCGKVQPGCEIVIPAKKRRENTRTVATSLSITTAIATVAAVLVSALK